MEATENERPAEGESWNRDQAVIISKHMKGRSCTHTIEDQNWKESQRCAKEEEPSSKPVERIALQSCGMN